MHHYAQTRICAHKLSLTNPFVSIHAANTVFIQVAGIATDPFGNTLIGDSKNFRILLFPRQKIDGEEDLDEAFTCISLEFYRNGKKFRQYRPSGINLVNGLLLIADLKGKAFLVAKVKK